MSVSLSMLLQSQCTSLFGPSRLSLHVTANTFCRGRLIKDLHRSPLNEPEGDRRARRWRRDRDGWKKRRKGGQREARRCVAVRCARVSSFSGETRRRQHKAERGKHNRNICPRVSRNPFLNMIFHECSEKLHRKSSAVDPLWTLPVILVSFKHTHTHTPDTQPHYLLHCCRKLSGRSKWVNVFDGILHFLNLPHRLAWLKRVFIEMNSMLECISKQEWISGAGGGITDSCACSELVCHGCSSLLSIIIGGISFQYKARLRIKLKGDKDKLKEKPFLLKYQEATHSCSGVNIKCQRWVAVASLLCLSRLSSLVASLTFSHSVSLPVSSAFTPLEVFLFIFLTTSTNTQSHPSFSFYLLKAWDTTPPPPLQTRSPSITSW